MNKYFHLREKSAPPLAALSRRAGFSLFEILATVLIISILAMILVPIISKIKEQSHKAGDLSNLRLIGRAFLTFAADHDGHLPSQPSSEGGTIWWPGVIWPYVESTKVFCRPGADYDQPWDQNLRDGYYATANTLAPDGEQIRWWYWINGPSAWQPFTNNENLGKPASNRRGRPLSTIEAPGRTVLMANGYVWNFPTAKQGEARFKENDRFFQWPNGTTHFLWVDGHVEARRPEELTQNDYAIEKGRFP